MQGQDSVINRRVYEGTETGLIGGRVWARSPKKCNRDAIQQVSLLQTSEKPINAAIALFFAQLEQLTLH
ncbi:hypothetical protein P886_1087 [Alteromonadaceae bacterium 2753L.S.0a.02]|nr:hypothetical protein P886_1087 [Alteromonadaceae bacterium 2753L.S.0a.02]